MQSVTDSSGQPTTFKYDDGTNRVVKKGAGGETLYINPWYVAALGRNSKQIFAGTARIATKLEQFPSGEGYGTGAKNLTEVYQYFYHPDHLGSTGFATDTTGEVYQHLEYFPFGETWVDEVSDDTRVPYRFTGQEWDPETRPYYYGARYFDPRTSVWQNPDPIIGSYLKAKAGHGVFQPSNINLYAYARQNPIIIIDPDGLCTQEDGCHIIDPRYDPERVRADMDRIGDFAVGFVPGSNYLDARRNWNEGRYGWATFHAVVGTGDIALSVVSLGGTAVAEGVVKGGVKAGVKQIGKTAAEDVAKATVEGTTRDVSKDLTYLYQKVGPAGEHRKFGIWTPKGSYAARYTKEELAGGRLKILAEGTKEDMLRLERYLHEMLPIGSEEGQKFYIQKQIEKGLKPPPY